MGKLTVQFTGRIDDDLEALAKEQGVPRPRSLGELSP